MNEVTRVLCCCLSMEMVSLMVGSLNYLDYVLMLHVYIRDAERKCEMR
jgi:hypothetical protein